MNGSALAEKLRKLGNYGLAFTKHAELRLVQRQIDKSLAISHIRNPDCLRLAERLFIGECEEKYKLWFVPFNRIAYIYVIVINHSRQKIIVKTAIKQRLAWQKRVEKNAK